MVLHEAGADLGKLLDQCGAGLGRRQPRIAAAHTVGRDFVILDGHRDFRAFEATDAERCQFQAEYLLTWQRLRW